MKDVFLDVLRSSFHGSVIIAVVLLLRLVLKNAPRRTICLLWFLAGLRLLLPFEIESRLSLQPEPGQIFLPQAQVDYFQSQPVPAIPENAVLPEDVEIVTGDAFDDPEYVFEYEVPQRIDWTGVLAWVWFAGVCGFAVYGAAAWLALLRRVRVAVEVDDGVYRCAGLDTAFVLGCFRPRIYLPADLTAADFVLAHERTHIRRGDHWFKLLGFATLALHWFNPLVWIAYLLLCLDLEQACDEAVVRNMDLKERKAYSAALLACAARRSGIAACPVAFGEESVEKRIVSVLNYRRPRFWICAAAMVAVIFVAVCFGTAPAGMTGSDDLEALYREQAMERCQLALADFQSRDSYCVVRDNRFTGDTLNDRSTSFYYRSGDDWLYHARISSVDQCFDYYTMEIEGSRYRREVMGNQDPANGDSSDTGWTTDLDTAVCDPWLAVFNWNDADLELTELSADGNIVKVAIQGNPHPNNTHKGSIVTEYEATFCFVPGTDTLQSVTLDYMQTWPVTIGGQERTDASCVYAVFSVQAMTPEEIASVIGSHYRQIQT